MDAPPSRTGEAARALSGPGALPEFPWDRLAPYARTAAAHPDGLVDLSVGTPVDPTPQVARAALAAAADAPGYPLTAGTPRLRAAAAAWLARRHGVAALPEGAVLPTIGSKELVALLPGLLGLSGDDDVAYPRLAYPTYDVGARLAGARPVPYADVADLDPGRTRLVWVNSPANPTGEVLDVAAMSRVVRWARAHGAYVVSDECYLGFGWDAEPVSVLDPRVAGQRPDALLAVHSLSKRSNLAGYRAGFVAGDPALVARLTEVRRHAGLMVPAPVQAAMVAVLDDDAHAEEQRERYRRRRAALLPALRAGGFEVDASAGGLYLWASRGEDCWDTVADLARRGVLVAPGVFYGAAGARHVRVALTAADERVAAAAARLAA